MRIELDLERRVLRLEWTCRVLLAVVLVLSAYAVMLGLRKPEQVVVESSPVAAAAAAYPRNIVAERVAVVDGEGREVAILDHRSLTIGRTPGPRISMGADAAEAGLIAFDANDDITYKLPSSQK
jgi:hypothetical protein